MGGEPKEYRSRRRVLLPWTFKGRQTCILALFCLAVLFSLRAWRVATILPGQLGEGDPWSPNDALKPGKDSDQCQWRPNGPLLYNLEHSNLHADGEDIQGGGAQRSVAVLVVSPALNLARSLSYEVTDTSGPARNTAAVRRA